MESKKLTKEIRNENRLGKRFSQIPNKYLSQYSIDKYGNIYDEKIIALSIPT